MNTTTSIATTVSFKNWGEFFSSPVITALCQATPITGGIASFITDTYQQQQYETMQNFLHLLHSKVSTIESQYIDHEFLSSDEGQRIIGKVLRSVIRDNRKEKLQAMANLTGNLHTNRNLTINEKELYVDILDTLNSLQLSILEKAVKDMRERIEPKHRGLGWEIIASHYQKLGVSKPLVLQSIRTLESSGIVNQNTATINQQDQTHFVTDFGEQFYDYISDESLTKFNEQKLIELGLKI